MVHTYSAVAHDDLPCMDNDDLRRGRPTNHKVFGETMAVLAGDGLQAAAFSLLADAELSRSAENRSSRCSGKSLRASWYGGRTGAGYEGAQQRRGAVPVAQFENRGNDCSCGRTWLHCCRSACCTAATGPGICAEAGTCISSVR